MTTYNGWRNRETWLVNVWYNPETVSDVNYLEATLWAEYEELSGFHKDMSGLTEVDWDELREAMDDEDEG